MQLRVRAKTPTAAVEHSPVLLLRLLYGSVRRMGTASALHAVHPHAAELSIGYHSRVTGRFVAVAVVEGSFRR